VKEESGQITIKSPELGEFTYPVALKGTAPSVIQRKTVFKVALGSDITQSFKFVNFCKKQTVYTCKIDKIGSRQQSIATDPKAKAPQQSAPQTDFACEVPTITAPPSDNPDGNEISINIRYEPSLRGES